MQVVQSTPPAEVLGNELIKEFAERCQSASRSIQGYINADNPPPDEDTLLTLIETNDALATALSKHQRAILNARKVVSQSPPPAQGGPFAPPGRQTSSPPPTQTQTQYPNSEALPLQPQQQQQQHSYTSFQPTSFNSQPLATNNATAQHVSEPQSSPRSELSAVAPAGPPPRLGMPRRVEKERMENPFDDRNSTQTSGMNGATHGSGIVGAGAGTGAPPREYGVERGVDVGRDKDRKREESDDDDAPAPARRYRF